MNEYLCANEQSDGSTPLCLEDPMPDYENVLTD